MAPAGLEQFFVELADLLHKGAFEQITNLEQRYDTIHVPERAEELIRTYQVRLMGQEAEEPGEERMSQ